jgi:nicotinamidase-related amidase
MGAWCRGYDVIVLKDGCSCPGEKEHEHALAYTKQFYGTEAMDSATWIAQLDAR